MPIDPVILTQDLVAVPARTPADAGALEVGTAVPPYGFSLPSILRFSRRGRMRLTMCSRVVGTTGRHRLLPRIATDSICPCGAESGGLITPLLQEFAGSLVMGAVPLRTIGRKCCICLLRFHRFYPDVTGSRLASSFGLLAAGDEEALAVNGRSGGDQMDGNNGQFAMWLWWESPVKSRAFRAELCMWDGVDHGMQNRDRE